MKKFAALAFIIVVAGPVSLALAEKKGDPSGTWKWKAGRQGAEVTLKLKLDGDKLSGSITGPGGQETPIDNASYKDGQISFEISREGRDGQKMTVKYNGKLKGDTIEGKAETPRGSRDWKATRSKD
jgi:hypothetical protein